MKILFLLIVLSFFIASFLFVGSANADEVKLSPIINGEIEIDWYQVGVTNTTKWDAVDDNPNLLHDGDSTYIWHDTINKAHMFKIADGNIPSGNQIDSVVLHIIAKDTGTGNQKLTLRIKFIPETPTVYYKQNYILSTSYTEFTFDIKDDELGQERNWIPSDFDKQQIEIGIRATGAGRKERRVTQMWLEVKHSSIPSLPISLPISTKIMLGIISLVMLGGVLLIIFKQLTSLEKFDMETMIKTIIGISFAIIVLMALLTMIKL